VERRRFFCGGEVELRVQHTARETRWLCIPDQVVDGTDPKWGIIVVRVEILFVHLWFMLPLRR
jgi:hypothetical protein